MIKITTIANIMLPFMKGQNFWIISFLAWPSPLAENSANHMMASIYKVLC
jgi:hypothetical protein